MLLLNFLFISSLYNFVWFDWVVSCNGERLLLLILFILVWELEFSNNWGGIKNNC